MSFPAVPQRLAKVSPLAFSIFCLKAEGLAMGDGHVYISYDNYQDDTDIPSQMRVVPIIDLLGTDGDPSMSGTRRN